MLREIQEHNNDYHNYTPIEKVQEWMKLADELKEEK